MKTKERLERAGWNYSHTIGSWEVYARGETRILYKTSTDSAEIVYGANIPRVYEVIDDEMFEQLTEKENEKET